MKLPPKLDDWNLDLIKEYLAKSWYETDSFDFKEKLPDPRDNEDKDRLSKSCCAFANSNGGFLVFGVADNKSLSLQQRLVGFSPEYDLPEKFGNYPKNCNPFIYWEFKNPPIQLENGNVIHIIFIPRSWQAPHSIKIKEAFYFAKRTNKSNEPMSYEEVRMHFLQFYEKRLKLGLLKSELESLTAICEDLCNLTITNRVEIAYHVFRLDILESVISDTYTILAENEKLLSALNLIRFNCNAFNNLMASFSLIYSQDMTNNVRVGLYLKHHEAVKSLSSSIAEICQEALNLLKDITT